MHLNVQYINQDVKCDPGIFLFIMYKIVQHVMRTIYPENKAFSVNLT